MRRVYRGSARMTPDDLSVYRTIYSIVESKGEPPTIHVLCDKTSLPIENVRQSIYRLKRAGRVYVLNGQGRSKRYVPSWYVEGKT